MDVNKAEAIAPASDATSRRAGPQRHGGGAADGHERRGDAEPGWDDDVAVDVHGLPTEGLSPEAQRLIDALAAQIEPMRLELEQARAREVQLRQQATMHPVLAVPNRREFGRELQHVIDHLDSLSPAAALLVVNIAEGEALRQRYGRAAGGTVMKHAAQLIGAVIHPTDTLGSLGGYDLGVILLNGDGEHVALRTESIRQRLASQPFQWHGTALTLAIHTGATVLQRGQKAADAVAAADRALLAGVAARSAGSPA